MRNYECVKVAFWNMKASRHLSIKVIIGLATVSMMLFCLFVYKSVFQQQISNMDEQYKTNCYLEKNIYSDSWDEYERYEIISKQIMAIFEILSFIILGFVFAITVYLFCILYFFFQSSQRFMFVLRAIGMKESKLYRIVFAELSLFCLISVAVGFYIGMFVLYGLKSMYDYAMPLTFEFDSRTLVFSAVAAFLYCFLVSVCFGGGYCVRQQKKNIVEGIRKFNLGSIK